jgi:tRNA A-37 threonylcarbamoyl transferase component Bud32/outer membrane protein assembly factor BamB
MPNPEKPETRETQGSERAPKPADVTAVYQPGIAGEELVRVLDQYLADLEAGRAPSREKLLADYPALASQLDPCLSGIEFIHRAARPAGDAPSRLGDFEIVGEVGRGGMGVVYEARQLSLKRKVALKVLRFAGVADKDAMERFQREAETVAQLHHTNIVPIFAIGEQKGVFYYAMQFIEGRSLAAVLEESQKDAAPLDLVEAARWTLQAAEALAHAHQRNVIHRDVKPSNLILDPAGQVWLTDFGLAKRIDDMTLSMTGALLGTPRYMSPEQASAAKQPVDQRTDIYSLGATLYELATGKPLFDAESAHGIISQILTTEPPPPRKVRTGLPRDLETIILKCLAKEASARYPTAQALADDLRAFCEGRAIKARRAGIAERSVRWIKTRKKIVAVAAIAAAATLAVAIVSYVTLSSMAAARLAHISFATEGPDQHFKVEMLDEAERKTIATFTAPTQEPQVIPAGRYHVRLSRAGQISETAQFEATAGSSYSAVAALSQRNLWQMPVADGETVEVARLDGRDDVFLARQNELRRMHGATGQAIWQISLAVKDQPLVEKGFHGDSHGLMFFWPNSFDVMHSTPCLIRPPLDLDGDGTPDLIWASRCWASLVAVSGKSGRVLWCHECRAALPEKLREEEIQGRPGSIGGTVVGEPLLAETGGKKIVAAIFALNTEQIFTKSGNWVQRGPQFWLEALNAQTGETLWRRRLALTDQTLMGSPSYAATTWKRSDRTIGAIACENRLFGFDLLTGQPAWPDRELDAGPPLVVRFADLRGDGELEILLLRETRMEAEAAGQGGNSAQAARTELRLTALSPYSATPLWERPLKNVVNPVNCRYGRMTSADWDWPLLVDLDGKGKPKVVVPYFDHDANGCGVEVLDGATGETDWKRPVSRIPQNWRPPQPERIVLGPDLDDDGYREIFAASYDEETEHVYVDALSGRDGRILWSNQEIVLHRGQPNILPLRWWQPGADGWPMLVVPYGDNFHGGDKVHAMILAASTGRVEHEVADLGAPEVFDLNGDGLPDLLVFDSRGPLASAFGVFGGTLRAIKGMPPLAWRVIGRNLLPGQDFNRDGYTDLLAPEEGVAISGRDAAVLWRSDSLRRAEVVSKGLPDADLDGDGVPDLLSTPSSYLGNRTAKVVATSGRDGKTIWTSDIVMTEDSTLSSTNLAPPYLAGHIFEVGKKPDVLVLYQRQRHAQSGENGPSRELLQTWLARLSGHDGHMVWEQSLTDFGVLDIRNVKIPFTTADLDGDGVNDLVFWLPVAAPESPASEKNHQQSSSILFTGKVPAPPARPLFELRAYSGRDGKLLWRRPGFFATEAAGPPMGYKIGSLQEIPSPVVCDPSGDGNPLVLVTDQCLSPGGAPGFRAEVLALDGKSGKEKWSWCGEGVSLNLNNGPLEAAGTWHDASPQIVRTATGPAIIVSAFDESLRTHVDAKTKFPTPTKKSGSVIVLLNVGGKVLRKIEDESPDAQANFVNFPPVRPRLWVHDLLGDGQDGLVWYDGRRVRAMRPAAEGILWEWERPTSPTATGYLAYPICGIRPAGKGFPATIAVASFNGIVGLAGPTGKVRWRCDDAHVEASSVLEADDPQGLPRILSLGPGSERTSYMALAADDHGRYVPPESAPRQYDSSFVDRRLLRPFPWARWEGQQDWGGVYIAYVIGILAAASIIGWWPGKLRRAVWFFGLWLLPWLIIEIVRFVLDARQLGPTEHYDWSTFWTVSIQDFRILMAIFMAIVQVWWLVRLVRWIAKKISARMRRVSGASR